MKLNLSPYTTKNWLIMPKYKKQYKKLLGGGNIIYLGAQNMKR
jgi:hypothetical protein